MNLNEILTDSRGTIISLNKITDYFVIINICSKIFRLPLRKFIREVH